jgi:long-subunit fatty acid transport protein
MMKKHLLPFIFLATNTSLLWANPAQNIFLANPKAISLGHAVTADPVGVDDINFNPAGLAKIRGRVFELKGLYAHANLRGAFTSSPNYDARLAELNLDDPTRNTTSEIESLAIYIPGRGITKIPAALVALPGFAVEIPEWEIVLANSIYAPLAGGVIRSDDDPGRFTYKKVGLLRLTYFAPTFAFELNDEWSFGAGLNFSYMGVGAETDVRFPNLLLGNVDRVRDEICESFATPLCAGDLDPTKSLISIDLEVEKFISPTANFGLLWEPNRWFRWGAVYHTPQRDKLRGKLDIKYSEDIKAFLDGIFSENKILIGDRLFPNYEDTRVGISIDLPYPQHFGTGISVQVLPQWRLNFDVKWTDLSEWNEWRVQLDQEVDLLSALSVALPALGVTEIESDEIKLPRQYKDVWNYAIGVEHQFNDKLVLRAGYEPRPSPMPDNRRDFLVPLGDIKLYSVGAGYQIDSLSKVDMAVAYLSSKQHIPAESSLSVNSFEIDNFIFNPYAGQTVDTDLSVGMLTINYQRQF